MQGFLKQPKEGQGRTSSIAWTTREEGHTSWAHFSRNLLAKLERSLLCVQVPLYLITCCIPCLRHFIYIHISQTGFPRGGFVQGHVDQKLHLFIFHVCLVVYQH
jgi:hypothetical protein